MKKLVEVELLQQRLVELGYQPGPIDGLFGAKTGDAYAKALLARAVDQRDAIVYLARLAVAGSVPKRSEVSSFYGPPSEAIIHDPIKAQPATATSKAIAANPEHIRLAPGCDWTDRFLVGCELPIVGVRRVHRECAGAFFGFMADVRDYLIEHPKERWGIKSFQCFNLRYSRGRAPGQVPDRRVLVSAHARACAFDVNHADNPWGKKGTLPGWFVRIAESWGFRWGGRWKTRDDMHFEWYRP